MTWSLHGKLRNTVESPRSVGCAEEKTNHNAYELKAKNETDAYSRKVNSYITYRLINKSQTYNRKTAACRRKYWKCMTKLMKAYRFDGNDPVLVPCSSAQFKEAIGSNNSQQDMDIWTVATFIKYWPATSWATLMLSYISRGAANTVCKVDKKIFLSTLKPLAS